MDKKTKIEIARFWLETGEFMQPPSNLKDKISKDELLKIFLEIRPSKLGDTDSSTISNADIIDYIDKLESSLNKEKELTLTERQLNILEEQKNIQKEQKNTQNKQNEIIEKQTNILKVTLIVYTLMAFGMLIQLVAEFFYNRTSTERFDQIFAGLFVILFAVIFSIFYNNIHKTLKIKYEKGETIALITIVLIFLVMIALYISISTRDKNMNVTESKIPISNQSSPTNGHLIKINSTQTNFSNVKKVNTTNLSQKIINLPKPLNSS